MNSVDPEACESSGRYKLGQPPPFGLFPPLSCFKAVCSCPECEEGAVKLKKFEEDIKSKYDQLDRMFSNRSDVDEQISEISSAVHTSRVLLELLRDKLKELGFSPKGNGSKLMKASLEIFRKLRDARLLDVNDDADDDLKSKFVKNVHVEIKRGLYYYNNLMNTEVKDEALRLLNDILTLEVEHENLKKSFAEIGEKLQAIISKSYIEQQIELLEMLPVEELCPEVEVWIYKFLFLTMIYSSKADDKILDICRTMAGISNTFWRTYLENGKCITGHDSTGLKDTLKNLCEKADIFEVLWQKKYALLLCIPDEGSSLTNFSLWVKKYGPPPVVPDSLSY